MTIEKVQKAAVATIVAYLVLGNFRPVSSTAEVEPTMTEATASLSCPPGFVPQGNDCVCPKWPNEIIVCNNLSKTASIQIGYCITYDNSTKEVRVGACPQANYRKDYRKFYYALPEDLSNLTEYMCGEFHSKGLLCGECKDGFSTQPVQYTAFFNCTSCNSTTYSWLKFIGISLLPSAIIYVVIVIFSISIVSGPVNAVFFFCQVTIGYFNIFFIQNALNSQSSTVHVNLNRVSQILNTFYTLLNLEFFLDWIPSYCLSKHLSVLETIALKYVLPFMTLLFALIPCICIQLHAYNFRPLVWCWKPFHKYFVNARKVIDAKTSVIDAFATFTLLSYVKILAVSHFLLKSTRLYDGHGNGVNTTVMYYSASIKYFHKQHLPYAIMTIFVLTFLAILPTLLLLYQTLAAQKCLTRCKVNCQALRTFVETFNGCFKDGTRGTRDLRYFAGLYFVLRIVVLLLSFASVQVYIAACALFYQFTAVFFVVLQPYKSRFNNIVDSLVFTTMAAVYTLLGLHALFIFFTGNASTALLWIVEVLLMLPIVYFVLFLACWVIKMKTNCFQRLKNSCCFRYLFRETTNDFDDTLPDRLLNPAAYMDLSDDTIQTKPYTRYGSL